MLYSWIAVYVAVAVPLVSLSANMTDKEQILLTKTIFKR